uniref:Lipase domain-containing protein n=1 Tax=Anopheles stephensi TaxID=30069 RepID=A0A182YJC7_ANOST
MAKGATLICVLLAVQLFGAYASPADSWKLVPDESGRLRLINTNPYAIPENDNEVEPLFNPETDVIFRLFTRRNPAHGQVLQWNNPASVQNSNFVASHPTRFTIHGWNGGETSGLHANIRQNYLGVGDFNVIAVDWGAGAQTANYIAARNRVASVGDIISRMVNTLVSATGTSRNNIYLIGHSLGAHAAGNAGKMQNGQLNTIIGLDPAGPLFSLSDADVMAPRDAQYTESIFTNAGLLGFDLPLSDSNFYPNGGRSQPGCGIDVSGNCAHSRAHELYAESVSTTIGFRSTRCASHGEIVAGQCTPTGNANMGGEPSNQGRGVNGMFIVNTNGATPFAQG